MTRAATTRPSTASAANSGSLPKGYLKRSELPFAALVFLLPFIVLYELGTRHFAFDPSQQTEQRIIAFNLLLQFFHWFGATGRYMPALAVVGILLTWHIARGDPWKVSPGTLVGMLLESAAWGLPLLVFGTISARFIAQHLPLMTGQGDWRTLVVLSIGAGIYEELVFRLIALTLLNIMLIDLLNIRKPIAYLLMVLISSLAFAFYHYLGAEQFSWQSLVFRTAAGVFFAGLFLFRGFGITAFSHSCYDIFVVCLRLLAAP